MARMLENAGYTAAQAYTGREAIEAAAQKPDLLLLDLQLPDMDGFDVARRLRNDPLTAAIPIIFMSASEPGAAAKLEHAQVQSSGFIIQPVEPERLLAIVQGALGQRAVKRQSSKPKRQRPR
jgi:CheY-like chemotaxis protein